MRLAFVRVVLFWTVVALADEAAIDRSPGSRFPTITLTDTQGRAVTLTDSLDGFVGATATMDIIGRPIPVHSTV